MIVTNPIIAEVNHCLMLIMLRYICFGLVFLVACDTPLSPVAEPDFEPAMLIPLEIGNEWAYRSTIGASVDSTRRRIIATQNHGGHTYYDMGSYDEENGWLLGSLVRVNSEGYAEHTRSSSGGPEMDPFWFFRFHHEGLSPVYHLEGNASFWHPADSVRGPRLETGRREMELMDTNVSLTVPAGSFSNVHWYQMRYVGVETGVVGYERDFYFAPGVGQIRQESRSLYAYTWSTELISYHTGDQPAMP
jgi:hypothetical protein